MNDNKCGECGRRLRSYKDWKTVAKDERVIVWYKGRQVMCFECFEKWMKEHSKNVPMKGGFPVIKNGQQGNSNKNKRN